MAVIKTDNGYEFFASDGGLHSRTLFIIEQFCWPFRVRVVLIPKRKGGVKWRFHL
jgi:hypothetical protein